MGNVIYSPIDGLCGRVNIPPSKSMLHRLVICSALSGGKCTISNVFNLSRDISLTIDAVKALGADCFYNESECTLSVDGTGVGKKESADIFCGESGSTVRFLIPIAAALGIRAGFTGEGQLPERPLGTFYDLLPNHGVSMSRNGLPLEITGRLKSGIYSLPGNVSSQFITGLLLALPLLEGESEIRLTTELQSAGYVDITIEVMKLFNVDVIKTATGYKINSGAKYMPRDTAAEGDWSQAAFYLTGAMLSKTGEPVIISGLNPNSSQGDKECAELYKRFGLTVSFENGELIARNNGARPSAIEIDAAQIPDLVPALAVCGAFAKGKTHIFNAERLRIKESDRLQSMAEAINALGGDAVVTDDGLLIKGRESLPGGKAHGANDHRVLMALSAAAIRCKGPVEVTYAESIEKSYPNYYSDYNKLGGKADVNMG